MNAPASAISPPRTQTPRISVGVCTCRATTEGLMKMPAPMIPPITTIVAWNSPNCRASLGRTGLGRGEVWFSVENILGCGSGRDARVLYHSRRADSSQHAGGISPQALPSESRSAIKGGRVRRVASSRGISAPSCSQRGGACLACFPAMVPGLCYLSSWSVDVLLKPEAAIHALGAGSSVPFTPATRTSTTGPKQLLGRLILASIFVSPSALSLTAPVVATTAPPVPPQTRLALTCVMGPGVPRATRTSPSIFTRSLPSSSSDALPSWTFHGAPPLGTPPITTRGFEPMREDRNSASSASALAPQRATITAQPSKILVIAFCMVCMLLPLELAMFFPSL